MKIVVLVYTGIYRYIPVYTGIYQNNDFHPGGQDSRCSVKTVAGADSRISAGPAGQVQLEKNLWVQEYTGISGPAPYQAPLFFGWPGDSF
jgi:hypothetical protein